MTYAHTPNDIQHHDVPPRRASYGHQRQHESEGRGRFRGALIRCVHYCWLPFGSRPGSASLCNGAMGFAQREKPGHQ